MLLLDRLEDVVVGAHDLERLLPASDLLAEDVDRRHLALLVQALHDATRVRDVGARDVALRDLADDRPGNGGKDPDDGAIEDSHRRPAIVVGSASSCRRT